MPNSLGKSANQFAVDLFQCYLRRHGDKYKNLLLCPYLIYHSLAMMLVGAKGQTAEQLMKLLRFSPTQTPAPAPIATGQPRESPPPAPEYSAAGSTNSSTTISPSSSLGSLNTDSSLAMPTIGARSPVAVRPLSSSSSSSSRSSRKSLRFKTSTSGRAHQNQQQQQQQQRQSRSLTPDPDEARHRDFLMLTEQLLHGNHEFVHLASFIYLDKSTKRTDRYKAILRDYYETKPKKLEFENVDLMVKTVNEDVARTTENIYNDILPKLEAQKLEKSYMLLVNAVFFRGFWLSNFTDVKRAPFVRYPAPSNSKSPLQQAQAQQQQQQQQQSPIQHDVNMMSKLDYLPIVSDQQLDARIVKMPFEASDLQMLLILPNDRRSDSSYLCEKISSSKINHIVEQFAKSKCKTVRVSMPIFCIDSGKISIQSTLVQMGASDLFDQTKANLSGVCENKQIWLNKILHRCFIICDNRGAITSSGSEKAKRRQAQLESGISSGRSGVDEFVADHPFMYIIIDSVTKTILLIGLYTDPSETLEVIHENQLSPDEAHQIYTEGVYKT